MIASFPTSSAQRRRYAEHMADPTTVSNLPPDPPPPEPTRVPQYEKPEPLNVRQQVSQKLPWDMRLLRWAFKTMYTGLTYYPLARSFTLAVLSGPTTKKIATERLAICGPCPSRVTVKGRDYCKQCGCGIHPLSRLSVKSRLAWAPCPRGTWQRAKPWTWRQENENENADIGGVVHLVDRRADGGATTRDAEAGSTTHGSA